MQLNTNKTGCISCLPTEVKTSPPGSALKKAYLWNYFRLIFIVMLGLVVSLNTVAKSPNPKITLNRKNSTLQEVFKEIQRQTKYAFVYNNEMMRETKRINIDVKDASLDQVLGILFKDQPVTYSLVDQIIVVKRRYSDKATDTAKSVSSAERMEVYGQVLDELSKPIPRASIVIKKSGATTATDNNGNFYLSEVPVNSMLLVTCVGYEPQTIQAQKNEKIYASLKIAPNSLDESIVVAYRTTTQKSNVGALTVVKGEQIQSLPNRSFDKSLQGLVPGLVVTAGSGQPGSAPASFVLRGIATGGNPYLGESFRNPLIVIDGVPVTQDPATSVINSNGGVPAISNPMAQINPSDIESITVLKDAAAASLYGSKASNGVLIVTTKRGKTGKTNIIFRHQTDVASRLEGKVKTLNKDQYLELLKESYKNSDPLATDESIMTDLYNKFPVYIKSPGDTSFYPQDNWVDALYDKHALTTANELSISGGTLKTNYYINFEYTKQNGVVKKTGYDRKSLRVNVDNRLTPWLKMGINSMFSYNTQNFNGFNGQELYISPLLPIRDINKEYIYNYTWGLGYNEANFVPNPVAESELNINRYVAYRGLSSLNVTVTPTKYLTLNSTLGFDFMLNETKQKNHPNFVVNNDPAPGVGRVMEENYRSANIISTNTLQFNKTFGGHGFQLMLGQEAQIRNSKFLYAQVLGIGDNPSQDEVRGGTSLIASAQTYKQNQVSYFSQLNYDFKNRYFFSGSIRRDGSSQFGGNVRFGSFWSAGAGYVITEEPWVKANLPWLNFFKVRGSIGSSGNSSAISNSLRYDLLSIVTSLGNTAVFPKIGVSPANPGIQWESTITRNFGAEIRIWESRVSLEADLYVRKTNNVIADNILLPGATGYNYYTDNIGDLKNKGIEFSLTYNAIRSKDFNWTVSAKWSKNSNRLVKAYYPSQTVYGAGTLINEVGQEYNSFYLPTWAGVNQANGRPQWIDSSTGKPTENYYAAKRTVVGKAQPDGFGSLSNHFRFKNIELSAMIFYQYGSEVFFGAGSLLANDGVFPYMNQTTASLDRWQKPGDVAANPRRLLNGSVQTSNGVEYDMGTYASTRYLYDGDFIRLANINIAYNFPQRLIQPIHVSSLRIFVQGNNLATWTRYSGRDPENINAFGSGDLLYPVSRSFSIGAQVGF